MQPTITDSVVIAVGGLVAVVALLFLAITRLKWHVFPALLVPILLFALVPGVDRAAFIKAFEVASARPSRASPWSSCWSILAEALKHTGGGAHHDVDDPVGGRRHMPLALTLSGFVIGIAIFSDVGYVILNPLVHSAALKTGLTMARWRPGWWGDAADARHGAADARPLAAVAIVGADVGA
jgi:GntP family gluconate:H+ symporter